jgi:hypothetical protein
MLYEHKDDRTIAGNDQPVKRSHLDGGVDEVLAVLRVGDVADGPDHGDPLRPEALRRLVHVLLQR